MLRYYLLLLIAINTQCAMANRCSLQAFVNTTIPMRFDGKFLIPDYIKHIKLDIGLSYSAPQSQYWLTQEKDLLVFGFEPNPEAVDSIIHGAIKRHEAHGEPLETQFIGKRFFLLPCALGLSEKETIPFFVTKQDCGCSSMFQPAYFELERVIEVPIFPLKDFFDLFPFDSHPVIDYIKIDAQGADLDIAKSAGKYLQDHVVYITLEAEDAQYHGTNNSEAAISDYMASIGFVRHYSPYTLDPTYFNPRFADYVQQCEVQIYQR